MNVAKPKLATEFKDVTMPTRSHRRGFVYNIAAVGLLATANRASAVPRGQIKAVAFDALAVFDVRPVFTLAEEFYPGRAIELANLWRTRQFEYAWLRTLSKRYSDFWSVTDDALVFAANTLKLELTNEKRTRLVESYLALKCWPDALTVLHRLKNAGIRLAVLSNFTLRMLESCVRSGGLESVFDHLLSTDRVQAYKPDPRAYQMGMDAFQMKRSEIAFAAFGGWDAAGAKSFGYPTFWNNRSSQPVEELGVRPDAAGATLDELMALVRG
jgi:2-haloacid dehalogenase